MTMHNDGIYQWGGVPVSSDPRSAMFDNAWFVDNSLAASGNGKKPSKAYTTIAAAVAVASSGDVIYVRGTGTDYDEAVTVSDDRVSLIGIATHPMMCGWNADADSACLTITGDGCVVDGFLFRPDGATTGGAINISETGVTESGLKTTIKNNVFKSTGTTAAYGILANGCPDYAKIYNNHFTWLVHAIKNTTASIKAATGWEIKGNYFADKCTNGVYLTARRCVIVDNYFSNMTIALDTQGYAAIGGYCNVHRNYFDGSYSQNVYKGNTTDDWAGNYSMDTAETEVADNGLTVAIPAV